MHGEHWWNHVRNGTVTEQATVELESATTIVVPENATVHRVSGGDVGHAVFVQIDKTLGFLGHVSEPMDYRTSTKNAGCAYKVDGERLLFSTFGEWLCHDGGVCVDLTFSVPEGIEVERSEEMSGEDSAAAESRKVWTTIRGEAD